MSKRFSDWRNRPNRSCPNRQKILFEKYNERNGWYVNWADLLDENEVYALVVEGSVDIQGLVAFAKNEDMKTVYVCWLCANPQNNKEIVEQVKYTGVGAHLFAIAAKKSYDFGYDGLLTGFAANQKLLEHYCTVFNAEHIGILHPFQFAIDEENAKKIMDIYDYEWTDEQI